MSKEMENRVFPSYSAFQRKEDISISSVYYRFMNSVFSPQMLSYLDFY